MNRCCQTGFLAMVVAITLFCSRSARAQHLWWHLDGQGNGTCLYGEITVLATQPTTYYCGANWHPGEPAGGYCGIQHNTTQRRCTIFSIWDTSAKLHSRVTMSGPAVVHRRFGGEGEGAHTHLDWNWKTNETFQFFVRKQPGTETNTTDTRYYIFDPAGKKWRHLATINNPNGGYHSVQTLGGSLASFLENYSGRDKAAPRLALYRLWLGPDTKHLKCLTLATGDGKWGEMHDCYFLASGATNELASVFARLEPQYGKPLFGGKGKHLRPVSDRPLSAVLTSELKQISSDSAQ